MFSLHLAHFIVIAPIQYLISLWLSRYQVLVLGIDLPLVSTCMFNSVLAWFTD